MKFHDLDADGVKDAGEPGLAGWTIYVDYDNDSVLDAGEPSAVTAAGGTYTISGIMPGTCTCARSRRPAGPARSRARASTRRRSSAGDDLTGNDFGNWTTATKTGMKFNDLDADGVRDAGEPGLAGWTIYVDYDNDSVLDAGEPSATATPVAPTRSPASTLAPRTSARCAGRLDLHVPGGGVHNETFTSGGSQTGNDFGNWTTATKSGTKFNDLDADGVKDAGEPGLAGWTIYVDYDNDSVARRRRAVGDHDRRRQLHVSPASTPAPGPSARCAGRLDLSFPAASGHNETFTSGGSQTGNDFGNWTTATKTGTKFHDLDADGVSDAGEPGLAGWTIYVDYDNDRVLDAVEPSADHDRRRQLLVHRLNPGTWTVSEVRRRAGPQLPGGERPQRDLHLRWQPDRQRLRQLTTAHQVAARSSTTSTPTASATPASRPRRLDDLRRLRQRQRPRPR